MTVDGSGRLEGIEDKREMFSKDGVEITIEGEIDSVDALYWLIDEFAFTMDSLEEPFEEMDAGQVVEEVPQEAQELVMSAVDNLERAKTAMYHSSLFKEQTDARASVYGEEQAMYPDETEEWHEDETDVDEVDSEDAGDGVESEQEFEQALDELRDSIQEVEEDREGELISPEAVENALKQDEDPCWDGYVQVGMKEGENGEMVPNCVPEDEAEKAMPSNVSKDEDPCWDGYVQVGMKEGENGEMVPNCVPEDEAEKAVPNRSEYKGWTYVDEPSEAPDDVNVEEAPQAEGRYRYETGGETGGESGGESDGESGQTPIGENSDMSDERAADIYYEGDASDLDDDELRAFGDWLEDWLGELQLESYSFDTQADVMQEIDNINDIAEEREMDEVADYGDVLNAMAEGPGIDVGVVKRVAKGSGSGIPF